MKDKIILIKILGEDLLELKEQLSKVLDNMNNSK